MALNVGSRLGHYDVTALIGEGGMGQVYQATDTKLNREVALKILPEAFAGDPDRLARFQREAQVLASLNHPNIAQIHGLEESDGTRALVLELVEGPTLADRIAQGPIPVDEALPIAKQIAEALEAAHEAGVIHRDLKPANIKVKDDGTVKVLDFGLAKALDTAPVGDPSLSPTLTAAATQMGVIMGTAAYMSPEQARGRAVDSRADIWGFGVVLYEMLTGKRAFEGEDVSLTLSTVLQREPDWSLLPVDVPVGVLTCLRRCLEKDSRQRIQAAGDVRLVIGGAFDIPGNAAGDLSSDRPQSSSRWRLGLVAVPVALLAAVTGFLVGGGTDENALPVMRTSISLPHPDGLFDIRGALAVAPDGRVVVYVTNDARLYQRPLDQQEPVEIATDGPASTPFFSPDGEWLGYYAEDTAEFRKVSLRQGTATVIVGSARIPAGVSWSADNRILFGQGADGIGQVSADGGTTEVLVAVEDGEQASQPSLLPDGETLLFTLADRDVVERLPPDAGRGS